MPSAESDRRIVIDGRWLRTVQMPGARALRRGYDRDATDGLLEECADTIDELADALHDAWHEVATLRRQARARTGRRSKPRVRDRIARTPRTRRRPRTLRVR